ncbi:MAG TPA: hypothetical protein VF681_12810 [Abditibacteriaceae bacterium]|jgi:hypothetical protein
MAFEFAIRNEEWRDWSRQFKGAVFTEGNLWNDHSLLIPVGRHRITLDTYRAGDWRRRSWHTRVYTPYVPANNWSFRLTRKLGQNALDDFTRATGVSLTRSIETRDAAFNSNYILKSNDEIKARALFENPRVRSRLPAKFPFTLRTGCQSVTARHLPKGEGFLIFHMEDVIVEPTFARTLCLLFGEMMSHLQPHA